MPFVPGPRTPVRLPRPTRPARYLGVALALLLGLSVLAVASDDTPAPAALAAASARTLPVVADAIIRADAPKATGGRARSLRVDGALVVRSFLRFGHRLEDQLELVAGVDEPAGVIEAGTGEQRDPDQDGQPVEDADRPAGPGRHVQGQQGLLDALGHGQAEQDGADVAEQPSGEHLPADVGLGDRRPAPPGPSRDQGVVKARGAVTGRHARGISPGRAG